jgi:tRNA dimethylallyltransferase
MQVYRGMDIGTAKPTPAERQHVRHYLIDLVEPEEEYSVSEFQAAGREIIDSGRHQTVVVVGGSGLHFRALVDPMTFPPHDPQLRRQLESLADPASRLRELDSSAGSLVDLANPRRVVRALEVYELTGLTPSARAATDEARDLREYRPRYRFRSAGLDPGPHLGDRIARRLEDMGRRGLLDEVASLAGRLGRTARNAVGYRQLLDHLRGRLTEEEAWEKARTATLALARRQRTYFRRDPRIVWVPWRESVTERVAEVARAWELA